MSSVTVRVDEVTKARAATILESLGLDLSTATRAFYRQIVLQQGIPFPITISHERLGPEAEKRFAEAQIALHDGTNGMTINEAFDQLGI